MGAFTTALLAIFSVSSISYADMTASPVCKKLYEVTYTYAGTYLGTSIEYENRMDRKSATLPAYATRETVIQFHFQKSGLVFGIQQGPYIGRNSEEIRQELYRFYLHYDPKKFAPLSLVRRTFGERLLDLNERDVHGYLRTSYMVGYAGEFVDVHLKVPGQEDGPLLMINRDSGLVLFWPENNKQGLPGIATAILNETQQHYQRENVGEWFTSDQMVRAESITSPRK